VLEAKCSEFSSSARVALDNYGPKPIRGYAIRTIQDYQYKRDIRSSTGVTSSAVVVAPGESEIVNFDGGFRTGKSYNKPTGPILRVKFWIKRLDFTDGTSWHGEPVPR
jgi:hypothetical protein